MSLFVHLSSKKSELLQLKLVKYQPKTIQTKAANNGQKNECRAYKRRISNEIKPIDAIGCNITDTSINVTNIIDTATSLWSPE